MNKKQLIVAWITGIVLSIITLTVNYSCPTRLGKVFDPSGLIRFGLPVLIIGSLLIYTLRKGKEINLTPKIKKGIVINPNIKKIIIREGIILIGIIALGFTIVLLAKFLSPYFERKALNTTTRPTLDQLWQKPPIAERVKELWDAYGKSPYLKALDKISYNGNLIMIFGYPLYLLIRLIIWTIKKCRSSRT